MTRIHISASSPRIGELLAILAECAARGVQRPPTGVLADALGISNSEANAAQRRLVERGEIVVEGNNVTSRIYVRSIGAWTAPMNRMKKGASYSAPPSPAVKTTRKCIFSDCRREFQPAHSGQWYCPQCRKAGRASDGFPRSWESA